MNRRHEGAGETRRGFIKKAAAAAVLHYRHVDQSDAYRVAEMTVRDGLWQAEIPGEYTDSAYPLLYYAELHDPQGAVWLYPGLNASLSNQPYFVVRRA